MQKVIPGILEQDPKETERKLKLFEGVEGVEWVHVDVADGRFVPNTTHGVRDIPKASRSFKLEVHLMVQHPEEYLADCWQVGADAVVFHTAAEHETAKLAEELAKYPFARGAALGLAEDITALDPYLSAIRFALVMSIEAGGQGRPFREEALERVKKAKELYPSLLVGVDGGVKEHNIQQVFAAGADYAIVGSAIMGVDDPVAVFKRLEGMAGGG